MEQVRQGKARALGLFEGAGLSALREGEDLCFGGQGATPRMPGAPRAREGPG